MQITKAEKLISVTSKVDSRTMAISSIMPVS